MIEKEYEDGTIEREVVAENTEEESKRRIDTIFEEAMESKDVSRITVFKNCYRNRPCPCGSGNKFKKCCISKVES